MLHGLNNRGGGGVGLPWQPQMSQESWPSLLGLGGVVTCYTGRSGAGVMKGPGWCANCTAWLWCSGLFLSVSSIHSPQPCLIIQTRSEHWANPLPPLCLASWLGHSRIDPGFIRFLTAAWVCCPALRFIKYHVCLSFSLYLYSKSARRCVRVCLKELLYDLLNQNWFLVLFSKNKCCYKQIKSICTALFIKDSIKIVFFYF